MVVVTSLGPPDEGIRAQQVNKKGFILCYKNKSPPPFVKCLKINNYYNKDE